MLERRWCRGAGVLWRHSLDAVLLLPPGAPDPVTLAGTGCALWELLEGSASTAELIAALAIRFDAEPAAVASDLEPVLDELQQLGAIEDRD